MKVLILKITVLYVFSGYKTRMFHSKCVILTLLCLVLTNILFQQCLPSGLRVNYSVNIIYIYIIVSSIYRGFLVCFLKGGQV